MILTIYYEVAMFKKILFLLFATIMLAGCSNTQDLTNFDVEQEIVIDGVDALLLLEFSNASIVKLDITGEFDDTVSANIEEITEDILLTQKINESGEDQLEKEIAVILTDLLEQRNVDASLFLASESIEEAEPPLMVSYDVVIVGSGAAGLSCANAASEQGKSVIVIEKMPFTGGSTQMSGAQICLPNLSPDDSQELFAEDMYNAGGSSGSLEHLEIIANNITPTVEWILDNTDLELIQKPYYTSGHSVARAVMFTDAGTGLVYEMEKWAISQEVTMIYNTLVTDILMEDSKAIGVKMEDGKEIYANDRVVIATGGFSYNVEMREQYGASWGDIGEDFLSSSPATSNGDGIVMAQKIGADIVDMENIQLYHYANPATGIHYFLEDSRVKAGSFYINQNGERFVNENNIRNVLAKAVLEQPNHTMYEVFTEEVHQRTSPNDRIRDLMLQWTHQGVMIKADTIKECAEFFELDVDQLEDTLAEYNRDVVSGKADEFGREYNFPPLEEGPFYIIIGKPSVHYTIGGIKTNTSAQVIDINGDVIDNLYAAGEVVGGIFGDDRLATTAIPDALVFGRIAGTFDSSNESLQ